MAFTPVELHYMCVRLFIVYGNQENCGQGRKYAHGYIAGAQTSLDDPERDNKACVNIYGSWVVNSIRTHPRTHTHAGRLG